MENKNIYPVTEMKKCILGCYELPMDTDLFEHFGETLKILPSWKKYNFKGYPDGTKNSFIRYVDYFYSPDLKCIKKLHPEERECKTACGVLAGFSTDENGNFDKKIENILLGQTEQANQMILEFLKTTSGSDEYATIKFMRDQHYKNIWANKSTLDGLEQQRIYKALKDLKELKTEFLNGDTSARLNISLIKRIEAENLNLSPESIAENVANGLNPLGLKIVDVYG